MSFSAHADAKGIMQLVRHCEPKNVLLVHGENAKMDFLRQKIMEVGEAGWLLWLGGDGVGGCVWVMGKMLYRYLMRRQV